MPSPPLVICECCDTVHRRVPLAGHGLARCSCCAAPLYRAGHADLDRMLALTLTAAVVFVIANCYPLMELEVGGKTSAATLWGIILSTYQSNVSPLAAVAALTVFFFPLLQLALYAWVLLGLSRGRVPAQFIGVMHALRQMQPWTMVEVFLLGLLVAVVKLGGMASATPELGMWGFALLTLLLTLLHAQDLGQLWLRADALGHASAQPLEEPPAAPAAARGRRGHELGLLGCHGCGLVLRSTAAGHAGYCPRCDEPLHRRKPGSLGRCWALLIAAAILYIPANVLPVMRTHTLFDTEDNTIFSGVIELWNGGAWDLALIVFIASIAVPLIKMACLALLLLSSHAGSPHWRHERSRIYRMVEFIGRWSMLDVFVVALLLSLVRFGILAEVQAGPGIIAFCSVVVLTMLASMSFDPRLIWDAMPARNPPADPGVQGLSASSTTTTT